MPTPWSRLSWTVFYAVPKTTGCVTVAVAVAIAFWGRGVIIYTALLVYIPRNKQLNEQDLKLFIKFLYSV